MNTRYQDIILYMLQGDAIPRRRPPPSPPIPEQLFTIIRKWFIMVAYPTVLHLRVDFEAILVVKITLKDKSPQTLLVHRETYIHP